MNQDEEHLRLLSIFHYVCAGLAALFACFPILYLVMGMIMVFSPQSFGSTKEQPPEFMGVFLIILGGVLTLLGWSLAACIAFAGRCLVRRKRHTFCLVIAGIACLFMPFGTILGVFSIVVLMRPSVKALFDKATPPTFAT
jgi:hypothetical protein